MRSARGAQRTPAFVERPSRSRLLVAAAAPVAALVLPRVGSAEWMPIEVSAPLCLLLIAIILFTTPFLISALALPLLWSWRRIRRTPTVRVATRCGQSSTRTFELIAAGIVVAISMIGVTELYGGYYGQQTLDAIHANDTIARRVLVVRAPIDTPWTPSRVGRSLHDPDVLVLPIQDSQVNPTDPPGRALRLTCEQAAALRARACTSTTTQTAQLHSPWLDAAAGFLPEDVLIDTSPHDATTSVFIITSRSGTPLDVDALRDAGFAEQLRIAQLGDEGAGLTGFNQHQMRCHDLRRPRRRPPHGRTRPGRHGRHSPATRPARRPSCPGSPKPPRLGHRSRVPPAPAPVVRAHRRDDVRDVRRRPRADVRGPTALDRQRRRRRIDRRSRRPRLLGGSDVHLPARHPRALPDLRRPLMTAAVACRDLAIAAGDRTLASNIALTVAPGELHAIMGGSGTGKSTLLWTVAGLIAPAAGSIEVGGEPMEAKNRRRAAAVRRRHVGIVYQQPNLITELDAVENVAVPLMMTRGIAEAEAFARSTELLTDLGIDTTTPTARLSGGEQQRVSIARAVIGAPAVILADEPTAALDETLAQAGMKTLLEQCHAHGSALLMVTHDSRIATHADVCWQLGTTLDLDWDHRASARAGDSRSPTR